MTISELFEQGWYIGAAAIFGYAVIALLIVFLAYQMIHDRRKHIENRFDRFFDKATIAFCCFLHEHFIYEDDEPYCPEWANKELWEESLRK